MFILSILIFLMNMEMYAEDVNALLTVYAYNLKLND